MGEHDEEELQRAFRMSLQPVPDAKRSRPRDTNATITSLSLSPPSSETDEARERRLQREVLAAAAEQRRMMTLLGSPSQGLFDSSVMLSSSSVGRSPGAVGEFSAKTSRGKRRVEYEQQRLPCRFAEQLYTMVFGTNSSKDVLAQWCNQGFRFSPDLETSLGLVQREGGPCGVLAPIQALVLKYLIFVPEDEADAQCFANRNTAMSSPSEKSMDCPSGDAIDPKVVYPDPQRKRALVRAMGETLWRAGGKHKAALVVLDLPGFSVEDISEEDDQDEVVAEALNGVALDSVKEFQRLVRVYNVSSISTLHLQLQCLLPAFRSRMGALLLLFSVLLSRGLDAIQSDRDDPEQPLVTNPFGHASQEIVNLFLCGRAVPNVFDGSMDLGGGMCLKGIPTTVEVGFLTLLESLNLCKVGRRLKQPRWPIWVVGSESHYTVLFASSTTVQDENDCEDKEIQIRQTFDAQDQSGGGGFISLEGLRQVLNDLKIEMPRELINKLCSSDIVVWNDFWRAICQIDLCKGGLKDGSSFMGRRYFELLHFNGIAKTVAIVGNGVLQRPRLTKLRVTVPPRWTPDMVLTEECKTGIFFRASRTEGEIPKEEPPQHAPLVDCIRTRWERASCNWSSDAPSIV